MLKKLQRQNIVDAAVDYILITGTTTNNEIINENWKEVLILFFLHWWYSNLSIERFLSKIESEWSNFLEIDSQSNLSDWQPTDQLNERKSKTGNRLQYL